MKTLIKRLLLLCFIPCSVFAQSNYKPGLVVTSRGDTVKGFIDYREWNSNPTVINFKTATTARPQQYAATDISYFDITGLETYVRYTGAISMDATDNNHLSTFRDTSYQNGTYFFKVLQKGKNVALYSYTDQVKTRLFIGEVPDYKPYELIYRLYIGSEGGRTVDENTYKSQLFTLANKYQVTDTNIGRDIEDISYNDAAILDIVTKLNHISKSELRRTAGNAKSVELVVSAFANLVKFSTDAGSNYSSAGGTTNSSVGPGVSVGFNVFANPKTQKLKFGLEFSAAQSKFKSLYDSKVTPKIPFRASFDELQFALTGQIIYNFYNAEDFKVYGGVGLSINFFQFSNPYLGSQSQPNSASDIEKNDPYLFTSSDGSFHFKAGVQIQKHFGLFVQYLSDVHLTKSNYWALSKSAFRAGISYSF